MDVLAYLDKSIATFDPDPAATEFQRGYFAALKVARAEIATIPLHPKLPEQPVKWYWAEQFDAEAWFGAKLTRDEAVADAVARCMEPPSCADVEGFWLISGRLALPSTDIPDELIKSLILQVEEDQCWFEDCGIDAEEAFATCDLDDGLRSRLKSAFEQWLVEHCCLGASRMVDDFLTMNFYRRVDLGDGLFGAVLDSDRVP